MVNLPLVNMNLIQLPHELQLLIFAYLVNDYSSLCALVLTSRCLVDCARELLRVCRTLDLSSGFTDDIEPVLEHLFALATDTTAPVPQVAFTRARSTLGDRLISHASRYKTLKINFHGRNSQPRHGTQPVSSENMINFELMMRLVADNDHYDISTWRRNIQARVAETSLRLLFHTARHLTRLEVEGSTSNILPWSMQGILEMLCTLKFINIENNKLPKALCRLVSRSSLLTLEFSNMSITSKFFEHFVYTLSITSLRFEDCWVATSALTRAIKACRDLKTFEYTLSISRFDAQPYGTRKYHVGKLLGDLRLHARTLKCLRVVKPGVPSLSSGADCNHLGSLVGFGVLRTLTVNEKFLAPHQPVCSIGQHGLSSNASSIAVLYKLPQSLQKLNLHQCDATTIDLLSGALQCMGLSDLLSSLHRLEVIHAEPQPTSTKSLNQRELAVRDGFAEWGVKLKFLHAS